MSYPTLLSSTYTPPVLSSNAAYGAATAQADTTASPTALATPSSSASQFAAPQLVNVLQALNSLVQYISSLFGQFSPSAAQSAALPAAGDPGAGAPIGSPAPPVANNAMPLPAGTTLAGGNNGGGGGGTHGGGGAHNAATPGGGGSTHGGGGSTHGGGGSTHGGGGSTHGGGGSTHGGGGGTNGSGGAKGGTQPTNPPAAGNGNYMPGKTGNKQMDQWDADIAKAAKSTGLPPNYIKATMIAESSGDPSESSHNPDGKHTDYGLMQISDYTYGNVMKDQPGAPRGLKAQNIHDNIMMGAWELKDKLEKAHGDFRKTSEAYVGTNDSAFNAKYAGWVLEYQADLDQGKPIHQH